MASEKKMGFFWGEEKMTVVEFDKDLTARVVSSSPASGSDTPTPFSSIINQEVQISAFLQKMLLDNRMAGGSFYVSLSMKDVVLRSFIIPNVKLDEIQNVIKYEAKKYVPFDIQDMSFVYYTIPVDKAQNKSLQVIFFAVRKEVLGRYQRIFSQANATISYCEPAMVSLTKALLFRKEIKPTDNLAFLILDKDVGNICFIDQGIPQFIREFSLKTSSDPLESDGNKDPEEILNLKILNEVGNSFDFYARQFSGDRIEQMLVASDLVSKDLLSTLERELKLKLRKFSPLVTTAGSGQSNDIEAIFAMGACISSPLKPLASFNFLENKVAPKSIGGIILSWESCKDLLLVLVLSLGALIAAFMYCQLQLRSVQQQYERVTVQEGTAVNVPIEMMQRDAQQDADKLAHYKGIRIKSDVAMILLRIAGHLPKGVMLDQLDVSYSNRSGGSNEAEDSGVAINIGGLVAGNDPNGQIPVVNQIFQEFKSDKDLLMYVKKINLSNLKLDQVNGQVVTRFTINCS